MLRLFIAIDLPASVREALRREMDRLAQRVPAKAVRWIRPDGIHLTLKFLGDTPAGRVDEIAAMMAEAARGQRPFSIEVGGLGVFPNPRRPRVIWAGLHEATGSRAAGNLVALHKRVEEGTRRLGYRPDTRRFNPHLTLGRVKKRASPVEKRRLGEVLAGQTLVVPEEVPVAEITLVRSQLNPDGAVYTRLRTACLTLQEFQEVLTGNT